MALVGWALVNARANPAMTDFWALATISDQVHRSASVHDAAVVAWIEAVQRAGSVRSHLLDTRRRELEAGFGRQPSFGPSVTFLDTSDPFDASRLGACAALGTRDPGWESDDDSVPFPTTDTIFDCVMYGRAGGGKKCCPEEITIDVTQGSGQDHQRYVSSGGGSWRIAVDAKWKRGGECKCECCEVRQYISHKRKTIVFADRNQDISDDTDALDARWQSGGPASIHGSGRVAQPGNAFSAFTIDGTLYVEDVLFNEDTPPWDLEDWEDVDSVLRVTDPRRRKPPKRSPCRMQYVDEPKCPACFRGEKVMCSHSIQVIIQPKAGCGGNHLMAGASMSNVCVEGQRTESHAFPPWRVTEAVGTLR